MEYHRVKNNPNLIMRNCKSCKSYVKYGGCKRGYCREYSDYEETRMGCIRTEEYFMEDFITEGEFIV